MKSYLRFLSRNKLYTAIEAVGLAFSLAFVIIIGCYAWEQYAVTHEAHDYKRIYALGMPRSFGLTYGFKDAVADNIPEIETISHISLNLSAEVIFEDREEFAEIIAVDPEFFDIFTNFRISGCSPDVLLSDYNVLVSETFANAHGLEPGSVLDIAGSGGQPCIVRGIVKDFRKSIFPYADILVPVTSSINVYKEGDPFDHFGSHIPFVKLCKDADFDAFLTKTENLCKDIYPDFYGKLFFDKVTATRFDKIFFAEVGYPQFNRGDPDTLRMLLLVGILLLISAVFNYINLSTALTGRRAKEMAARRLLGASREEIIGKYLCESLSFTAVCFGFALLLAVAIAPAMDKLLNNPYITVRVLFTPASIAGFVAVIAFVGILSGLIPALLASKFKAVDVMKGSFKVARRMRFSHIFIILQNALAVFLIAMAIVMEAQYAKSLDRPKHINTENLLYLILSGDMGTKLSPTLSELPCVSRIGRVQGIPGFRASGQYSLTRDNEEIMYRTFKMDSTAFAMFGFEKTRDFGASPNGAVWLGERAFAASGFDEEYHDISVLAQRMSNVGQMAGTIADFPHNPSNMGDEDYLLVQVLSDTAMESMSYALLLETSGDKEEARRMIMDACRKWFDDNSVIYQVWGAHFLDDNYREALVPAHNNMRLMEIFMLLAIMISMLGLAAMSTWYAGENAHSIAVRKVFGSTVEAETAKSVAKYMKFTGISCAAGVPAAVWAAGLYLELFIYRIENYWWIFVAAVLLSALIALISVCWQVLYSARTNPAIELKKE